MLTGLSESGFVANEGVDFTRKICNEARIIFREITKHDIGIDAHIEPEENGNSLGIIIGLQIKSGDSYVNDDGTQFKFIADREHIGYWARCNIPIFGIVHSPKFNRSVWFDIKAVCTNDRIRRGPYTISIPYNNETSLDVTNLKERLIPKTVENSCQEITFKEVYQLIELENKREAWIELINEAFDPDGTPYQTADVMYRLSWYFPAVPEDQKSMLLDRLKNVSLNDLKHLVKIFSIDDDAFHDSAVEIILDLFMYIPNSSEKLQVLLAEEEYDYPMAIFIGEVIEWINSMRSQ